MLYFALYEAVFCELEFDGWVVEGCGFVVHGLNNLEALCEVGDAVL